MSKGKVLWFNDRRGFGFIRDENDREVFVHYSAIISDGFKTLSEDQEVEFELYEEKNGKCMALNVKKVEKLK